MACASGCLALSVQDASDATFLGPAPRQLIRQGSGRLHNGSGAWITVEWDPPTVYASLDTQGSPHIANLVNDKRMSNAQQLLQEGSAEVPASKPRD